MIWKICYTLNAYTNTVYSRVRDFNARISEHFHDALP